LSTLTKVLIVLLTVFSLVASTIVVTFVANQENYRQSAEKNRRDLGGAEKARDNAQQEQADAKKASDVLVAKLEDEKNRLTRDLQAVREELDGLKRTKNALDTEHAGMMAAVQTATTGEQQQRALFVAAQKEVERLKAEQIQREAELKETNQMLLEKLALISDLDGKIRQLTQENQDLGTRVNQYLTKYGQMATKPPTTVAQGSPGVRPAQPAGTVAAQTRSIALNGQVTAVDLRSRLLEISIGTAAGVRKDMTFHVVRGDRFVADILIMEVWPDRAVGVLDVVQAGLQPQAGDSVSTNL
jgi:septal ring factor EnvC (AmiA/AmiB activator)